MSGPLVLSLFPGLGLLDMAFEGEGFTVVRGPDCLWGGDVRRFHPPTGVFDGVIGGPPCQAFSALANLVRARGYEPRFGNLIPEFERCVAEAEPRWFLMENVPQAPEPVVEGYGARSILLANEELGEEQERQRRFSFGVCGGDAPNLRRWIQPAALMLPKRMRTVTGRHSGAINSHGGENIDNPVRTHSVTGSRGYSQTEAKRFRTPAVTAAHGRSGDMSDEPAKGRTGTVTSSDGGASVRMMRYRLPDAIRLQGLPPDFLADAPFTAAGKLKAIANGVPLPMGRAIARAVRAAIGGAQPAAEEATQ